MKTRRDERKEETLREIKTLAWQQIAEVGAANLSLRAVSRKMRMSSAALFRHYASREELLTALSAEAFQGINAAMHAASAALPPEHTAQRITSASLAFRAWALENPEKYALIYGSPITGYRHDWSALLREASQGLEIIIAIIAPACRAGTVRLPQLPAALHDQLQSVIDTRRYPIPAEVLYAAITGWTRLHGLVSLEVFGHLSPLMPDVGELYRYEISALLRLLGLIEPDAAAERGS